MSQERFLNKICFFSFLCCCAVFPSNRLMVVPPFLYVYSHVYIYTRILKHVLALIFTALSCKQHICIQSELFQFCRGKHKGCVRIYGPCHPWQWLLSYSENLQNLFGFKTYSQCMKRWVLDLAIFSAFDRGSVVESGDEHAQRDCFKHLCFAFHVCSTIQFLLSSKVI